MRRFETSQKELKTFVEMQAEIMRNCTNVMSIREGNEKKKELTTNT